MITRTLPPPVDTAAAVGGAGQARLTDARPGLVLILVSLGVMLLYPGLLRVFHVLAGPSGGALPAWRVAGAAVVLLATISVPAIGMALAAHPAQSTAGRRLAYASVVAPTLFVFLGVLQILVHSPLPDEAVWTFMWVSAAVAALAFTYRPSASSQRPPAVGRLRVAHGIAGAVVLSYVVFHLTNHLFGLVGPQAHARVMDIGRRVYRTRFVEPFLVAAMLFQIGSGACLVWRWSAGPVGFHRIFQVASGVYLSVFVLGHMNSVFIYARSYLHIPTDWSFATGGPAGLLHDPWNIRLVPHYLLGAFFALAHLSSGLRVVLLAHGIKPILANSLWVIGAVVSATIAAAIMIGMCGVRVT